MSNFQHAGDWLPIHGAVTSTLDPPIKANYRNAFGADASAIRTTKPSAGTRSDLAGRGPSLLALMPLPC